MPSFLLRLPAVRGPLDATSPAALAAVPRLWPGLPLSMRAPSRLALGRNRWLETPAPQGPWFTPPHLPYTPEEAAACLEDMRRLGQAALSGVPLETLGQLAGREDALRRQSEAAARQAFAACGGGEDGAAHAARAAEQAEQEELTRAAQRMLLWSWLQEERLAEMAALDRHMRAGQDALAAMLGEAAEDAEVPAMAARLPGHGPGAEAAAPDAADMSLLPPWERVLDAAAVFLPEGAVLLAEGAMRQALLEREDLRPLTAAEQALFPAEGPALCGVRAPLWQLLRRPRALRCRVHWQREFLLVTWGREA